MNTARNFLSLSADEARATYSLGKDARDWKVLFAQKDLRNHGLTKDCIVSVLYRPFDRRYTYYTGQTRGFIGQPQRKVMRNMLIGDNLGLSTVRGIEIGRNWEHIFCTRQMIQHHTVSLKEVNYLFPLYVYPADDNLLDIDEKERKPNLAPEFVKELSEILSLRFVTDGQGDLKGTFGPEDVFYYAYAVFHSPSYRKRYAEFLKRDFPRLPLTSDRALFSDLSQWGEELVSLHLMRYSSLNEPFTSFPKSGSNVMEKAKYVAEENRVYINKEQYFENVPEETWYFRVGGYQVLDKWLKDRKGRTLTTEDIEHYRRVVAALHETARIMQEIDEVIEARGGWPLAGSVSVPEKRAEHEREKKEKRAG